MCPMNNLMLNHLDANTKFGSVETKPMDIESLHTNEYTNFIYLDFTITHFLSIARRANVHSDIMSLKAESISIQDGSSVEKFNVNCIH